jgi:hypothetical protein
MEGETYLAATAPQPGLADEASAPFEGRWHRLESTTNWERGRIISEWRQALQAAGAQPYEYSDEAWSKRVGGVTPQHVGRLRRVHERFAAQRDDFPGLYWSHFQAALDWDDAEMWLEGAVHSGWTVAEMRSQRQQALAALGTAATHDQYLAAEAQAQQAAAERVHASTQPAAGPLESDPPPLEHPPWDVGEVYEPAPRGDNTETEPALPELPADLAEAFELFKLAILRHKLAGWTEISAADVCASLDWLRCLALSAS